MYESEITRFIRSLREKNPGIPELQKKNRATWWDKTLDPEVLQERAESAVPQPPYVYFPLPRAEANDDRNAGDKPGTTSGHP